MSLATLKFANLNQNANVVMGMTQIQIKDKVEDVIAISPIGENQFQDPKATRFYISPLIARTAFDDLGAHGDTVAAFAGRTYDEMQAHLLKNQK